MSKKTSVKTWDIFRNDKPQLGGSFKKEADDSWGKWKKPDFSNLDDKTPEVTLPPKRSVGGPSPTS